MKPIATVINNNQPGWTNIVETEPHVTLDVGTELCVKEERVVLEEIEATPAVMRETVKAVDVFKNQRVFFIPMPVLNVEDVKVVEDEMKRRVKLISDASESVRPLAQ